MDIRDFVCPGATSATLSSSATYVEPGIVDNPIGIFTRSRLEIIKAGNAPLIAKHPIIGRLLLLGAVSAFENYCRGVLAGCLAMCPISQGKSSEKNVSLGGAIWHGSKGDFNRSAFEHKSLADTKELKSVFREYIGFELNQQIFSDLLVSFEIVMQLRHAVVHSDGYLPGRNAVKLEIGRTHSALLVCLNQNRVQECLLVLSALVATINRELFASMCQRWAVDWRQRADWNPASESKILKAVFDLFVDRTHNRTASGRIKWSDNALKQDLYRMYDLA